MTDTLALSPSHHPQPYTSKMEEARLTDQDIQTLIQSLQPHEELDNLRMIEKSIRETETRRRREKDEMQAKIHALEQSLLELRRSSTRSAADWRSLKLHAETIEKLDNKNFDLAKKINDDEAILSNLQAELSDFKKQFEEVDSIEIENEHELDKEAICLKIFKSLGFLPSKDSDSNQISSILVRSDHRNAAIPIDISEEKCQQVGISPYILAEQLWKAAE